jgi:hypothetical protein
MPGMQQVTVTVANNQITVDRETVNLHGQGPNVQIQWNIATPGWTFPDNGIVIANNDGQFHSNSAQQGTRYMWHDRNTGGKTYKYTINVSNGSTPLSLDPMIANEG